MADFEGKLTNENHVIDIKLEGFIITLKDINNNVEFQYKMTRDKALELSQALMKNVIICRDSETKGIISDTILKAVEKANISLKE